MGLREQLVLYRKQAGLSIDELAAKSGIPVSTVKKISAGITKDPQIETLRALAYALGKTLDDFTDSNAECSELRPPVGVRPLPTPEEQDEVWQLREQLRRDPERRVLFDAAKNVRKEDILTAVKILDALKGGDFPDD